MNLMLTGFLLTGSIFVAHGQNTAGKSLESEKELSNEPTNKSVKTEIEDTGMVKVQKSQTFTEGEIPTPEEQGFIKQTINGKEVYVKQQGQLLIQYEPKK